MFWKGSPGSSVFYMIPILAWNRCGQHVIDEQSYNYVAIHFFFRLPAVGVLLAAKQQIRTRRRWSLYDRACGPHAMFYGQTFHVMGFALTEHQTLRFLGVDYREELAQGG